MFGLFQKTPLKSVLLSVLRQYNRYAYPSMTSYESLSGRREEYRFRLSSRDELGDSSGHHQRKVNKSSEFMESSKSDEDKVHDNSEDGHSQ